MADTPRNPVRLADYRPPPLLVEHIELDIELDVERTVVHARLHCRRNPLAAPGEPLHLDGEHLQLLSIALDGRALAADDYALNANGLILSRAPDSFVLETRVAIAPSANRSSLGLHRAGGALLTQCEAEGFRRITYFPDRPDVLSVYRTTLRARRADYPVLLGNGNAVARGGDGERHWVCFDDPVAMPCYVFALVAGNLTALHDQFVTRSGRTVALAIWTTADLVAKCDFAMQALKRAMAWEETRYGLEYDLDSFAIAALPGIMIQMENKGLNIFNAEGVATDPWTTSDTDYLVAERIIGSRIRIVWRW